MLRASPFLLALLFVGVAVPPAHAAPDTFGTGSGREGARIVDAANTVINAYATLDANAAAGSTALTVTPADVFNEGDLVLVWQTSGANPSPALADQNATLLATVAVGHWEFARITGAGAGSITLAGPLTNAYRSVGAQVIRVPEYESLSLTNGGSIVPEPWNGSTGGIVVALVAGELDNEGLVDVSGLGFRGGEYRFSASNTGCSGNTEPAPGGAARGESIATPFPNGTGRANRSNGGGGGVCALAGGGGGGHGARGGVGGRSLDGDRVVGGFGGSALTYSLLTRMSFGGGGGAGQGDGDEATDGASGGGAILIRAGRIRGSGTFNASGNDAFGGPVNNGSGGGGAGGAVLLRVVQTLDCGGVEARGGAGGDTDTNQGPGGGGSGGFVLAQSMGGTCPVDVDGGGAGTQPNTAAPGGARHGAANGNAGSVETPSEDFSPDSDGDTVADAFEAAGDTDNDGLPDVLDDDDDGDGIPTASEGVDANTLGAPVDPRDTDQDGVPDYLDNDDDGDGLLTIHERPAGTDRDSDGDNTPDHLDGDDDNDGVLTRYETADPNGDGNPADARDTDSNGTRDYRDNDDDGDGVLTRDEADHGDGDPSNARDTDNDGTPDYLDNDDDNDGLRTL